MHGTFATVPGLILLYYLTNVLAVPAAVAGYVAALFLLAATAYAVFQVPYVTMPAEMTEDPGQRRRVLGWRVGSLGVAILHFDGLPPNLHLTLTPATVGQVDALLTDLDTALRAARALAPVTVVPALAELAAGLDPSKLGPAEIEAVLAFAGLTGDGGLPARTAPVLILLDALPGPLKERLLTEFVGSVFRI